ncbi:ANTAR domain-containing protein [Kaistia dalseonensis]|uniref:AmiR/NasT family two-component response regulator n=1 Tax=Kaistia dalseonensis TaxID=410840 RepID=A0ABU0H892_9HYPH|nr:ANTAR domain-containing protein [Kaistia dalseonensis]MCX5495629.1 ANTAR domain-containing protein [Kaistia dalseonensis]MDQ0438222.1 AmiR/NasT family two-component response regulator [Kaistia dalseonensis]
MAPRVVQNFRGSRALVIASDGGSIDTLDATLIKLGLTVEHPAIADGLVELDMRTLRAEADILFIDGDLGVTLACESQADRLPPVPVIGLVGVEAPGRLKALLNQGATAFLRKPVHVGAVYTTLFLGINQFLQRRDLELQLDDHQKRRRRRRVVVKAIVLMMQRDGLDDEEAYAQLRRDSMRVRCSLEDYCEDYLNCRSTTTVDVPSAEPRLLADRR